MSEEQPLIGTDFSGYIELKRKNQLLSLENDDANPLLFVKNIAGWVVWRSLRIVSRFLSFIIFLQRTIINLKTDMLQMFYWGRSGSFGIFLQSIGVFIVAILGFTFFVGGSTALLDKPASAGQEVSVENYAANSQSDVLIQTGSLETQLPQELQRIEMVIYTVKPADSLTAIAEKFELNEDSIRWANDIKTGDTVKAGQQLRIPPGEGVMYKVQNGDNLEVIAAKTNSSQQAIADVNLLDRSGNVTVGAELFIPNGTLPQPTKAPTVATRAPTVRRTTPVPAPPTATRFLSWPVQGGAGYISQCPNAYHVAVDIADKGAPNLIAAAPGRVTYAGYHNSGYAWVVEIDHGNGYSSLYAHMVPKSITVSVGQYVDRGQVLGRMGQSGLATGVHIHFELSQGGGLKKSKRKLVPPAAYMINSYCGY
jgi:murein DD-endopeptidase MepM/ murein hydrolase activator NlpD